MDALGSAGYVARVVIGAEKIVDFTKRETYLDLFANQIGATFARTLSAIVARFEIR